MKITTTTTTTYQINGITYTKEQLLELQAAINELLPLDKSPIVETKDLGRLTWNEAMAAVENDPTWRLPTIHELIWIYKNRDKVDQSFAANGYWSSTEASATNACGLNFNGCHRYNNAKTNTGRVRAVRRDQFDNLGSK